MAIYLNKNPYRGINAHFNSYLQNEFDGWRTFHNNHITNLTEALNRELPAGYYAVSEKSLQIQSQDDDIHLSRPNIGIFESVMKSDSTFSEQAEAVITPTLVIATEKFHREDEEEWNAIEIYQQTSEGKDKAVTRIELLSPTNKRKPQPYLAMRERTIESGIKLVEIDYLHETPTIFRGVLLDYTKRELNSYPYYIAITDSTPTEKSASGFIRFYCFQVDDPIPPLPVPLTGKETVMLDFGAVYQYTFSHDRRAHLKLDYEQLPVAFKRYSQADRERIKQRMTAIAQAQ